MTYSSSEASAHFTWQQLAAQQKNESRLSFSAMIRDPLETGDESLLFGVLTARDLAISFGERMEMLLTSDDGEVLVFARLPQPEVQPEVQEALREALQKEEAEWNFDRRMIAALWHKRILYYDPALRRIGLRLWSPFRIAPEEVRLILALRSTDAEVRRECGVLLMSEEIGPFANNTLRQIYMRSLRTALDVWRNRSPFFVSGSLSLDEIARTFCTQASLVRYQEALASDETVARQRDLQQKLARWPR